MDFVCRSFGSDLKETLVWHIHDMPSYFQKENGILSKIQRGSFSSHMYLRKTKGELIEIGFPEKSSRCP
jgi:hypothetical protein